MDFEDFDRRTYILAGSAAALFVFIAFGMAYGQESPNEAGSSQWQEINLEDVNSGQSFTINQLERPVLVETFAVWCPTCTNQQNEIKKLKRSSNVTSVSLDVDSNEDKQQIRQHTQENGFDWRYAISPPELTRMLIQEYGNSIANPPSAPVILVCQNTSKRLSNGVKTASTLQDQIQEAC
ncbi:MAG: redoxin [Candidatus Nanosalina sp. J07AB43]|jgi:Redoxin.|nr:MAG: redoxin [Candidatus Nanosalina sp. J07AB43]